MGTNTAPIRERYLGMDAEPGAAAGGRRGLRVVSILPESTAEKSVLQAGDLILSINGQVTEERGALGRIIGGLPSGSELTITLIKASTGREQTITTRVP
jgi:S1-C subfamily serine protease